jgi:hypothetical protein
MRSRTSARSALRNLLGAITPLQKKKEEEMKPTSKMFTASAASLFTFVCFVMTAPVAHAEEYCITGGAQAAHGCGYPNMEACQAASRGIGGSCSVDPASKTASKNPSDAMGQAKQTRARAATHPAAN